MGIVQTRRFLLARKKGNPKGRKSKIYHIKKCFLFNYYHYFFSSSTLDRQSESTEMKYSMISLSRLGAYEKTIIKKYLLKYFLIVLLEF